MYEFGFHHTIKNEIIEKSAKSFYWAETKYLEFYKGVFSRTGSRKGLWRWLQWNPRWWRTTRVIIESECGKKLINPAYHSICALIKWSLQRVEQFSDCARVSTG